MSKRTNLQIDGGTTYEFSVLYKDAADAVRVVI